MASLQAWIHGGASIVRWFQQLGGRRRLLVAAALGGVTGLGFAPFHLWPLWFLTLPGLVWIIDSIRPVGWRSALSVGWGFGFGYFLVGMHWIGFPFVVDTDRHAWMLPFAIVLFPAGLALFWGAAVVVAGRFWHAGAGRVALLAASLSGFEWLRGHILTGLPWNLPGYVWSGSDTMVQSAALYGIYGLSLVTLLILSSPAVMMTASGTLRRRGWIAPLVGLACLVVLWVTGMSRIPTDASTVFENVSVRLVQPNVPQHEKWKPEFVMRNWQQLVQLSTGPGLKDGAIIVWPEAAPPFFMLSTEGALEAAASFLPDKSVLLTGTQRVERGEPNRYFNSMAAIDGQGRVLATHDKSHLVPFGEYLPLFQLLQPLGITQLTGSNGGFSEGAGVRTIQIEGLPSFGVLICYEIIFPGNVVEPGARPQWLVNMTDDSWFGPWAGPFQHLGIAKVRAVEEGLSVARAANTGISAMIDPYGRIIASLELDRPGVVDAPLPRPIEPTLYSLAGDAIFFILMLALVGLGGRFSRTTP
jgi:apolipoprotein N-acyltransferase